MFHIF